MSKLSIWIVLTLSLSFALGASHSVAVAQGTNADGIWSDLAQSQIDTQSDRPIVAQNYRALRLNASALQQVLQSAPLEGSPAVEM